MLCTFISIKWVGGKTTKISSCPPLTVEATLFIRNRIGRIFLAQLCSWSQGWPLTSCNRILGLWGGSMKTSTFVPKLSSRPWCIEGWVAFSQEQFPWMTRMMFCSTQVPSVHLFLVSQIQTAPPWHRVSYIFRSEACVPFTSTMKGRPRRLWKSSIFCQKGHFLSLPPLWSTAEERAHSTFVHKARGL